MRDEKKENVEKPFFAQFIEEQELDDVRGGRTLKYPSDTDEIFGVRESDSHQ